MHQKHWLVPGFILANLVAVPPAGAESLSDALAAAYGSNPTLLSERAKLRATDELVPEALSNWRPQVSLSGSGTRSLVNEKFGTTGVATGQTSTGSSVVLPASSTSSANFTTIYSNETIGLTVTEALYRGGRTVAQTRQAEAQVEAIRAELQVTEQQVLLNVATAYMNLVQAQAVLQLTINNEQVLQRQLEAVEDRFRVGEVTRTDQAQAQSRLSAAHADRTQAEGNLRTARATYLQTVGHAPEQITAPTQLPALPDSLEAAQGEAQAQNPAVAEARFNYQAALEGIDLIAGELLPQVAVSGSASRVYNFDGPATLENVAQAVVSVTVPLYQQGQEYARLRGQKQTASQFRGALDQALRDVAETTSAAWEALLTGRARRLSYQDQVASAQIALEGVQRESQVGSRTVLDVLNAEQELLTAQVNAVQANHDEIVAAYQLLSAAGRLTARGLGLPVEHYDPGRHYEEVRDKWVGFGED
jgi:outer membrane protein